MQGIAIEFGVHRDRRDPEFSGRPDDPDGDFPTVGDQDLLEHRCHCFRMDLPGARWRGSWPRDWEVRRVAATGSTNADLLVAAHAGAPDRLVLVADHQTAGAGRLGRIWDAPPGTNLLVSLLLRSIPAELHQLTQRVGLAALAAVAEISGREARLKWPNDVLLDGRKLAGILAQAASPPGSSSVEAVVVGLGLNVGWAPPEAAC
ncbi:MAG: biotin--[acetyl-CoA-carboxylase] ligase, partial [Ilumatobacteraceae bacterium]